MSDLSRYYFCVKDESNYADMSYGSFRLSRALALLDELCCGIAGIYEVSIGVLPVFLREHRIMVPHILIYDCDVDGIDPVCVGNIYHHYELWDSPYIADTTEDVMAVIDSDRQYLVWSDDYDDDLPF